MTELVFRHFDAKDERRREALMALGNGVLSWRASAPEAGSCRDAQTHYAGLYRAGFYDAAQRWVNGQAVHIESLVNLPDPFGLSFSPDAQHWFGGEEVTHYEQSLDIDVPVVRRQLRVHLAGHALQLHEERFLSVDDPTLAVVRWTLESAQPMPVLYLRSMLDTTTGNTLIERNLAYEGCRLEPQAIEHGENGWAGVLAQLPASGERVAVVYRLFTEAPLRWLTHEHAGQVIQEAAWHSTASRWVLEKRVRVLGVVDSLQLLSVAEGLGQPTFQSLRAAHGHCWKKRWDQAQLIVADESLALPLRLGILHVLQTVPWMEEGADLGFPSRGWQEGYFGQVFWDEMFAFPFLASHFSAVSRRLLEYRHRRLDAARSAARQAGYRGAMFPWRSASSGTEQTPPYNLNPLSRRWMADHTCLQRHIGSAVVFDVWQHYQATGDSTLLSGMGGELIVEIARFWASAVDYDPRLERYVIRGVIGPDEYHNAYPDKQRPGLDNNAYTNVMAAWVLCQAQALFDHLPAGQGTALRARLGLDEGEVAHWAAIASRLYLPFLQEGILSQFDGYHELLPAPAQSHAPDKPRLDWLLEARHDCTDRYQLTKQADVLTLFHLFGPRALRRLCARMGYEFDDAAMRRTVRFHLARITHESSLSKMICAGALAHLQPHTSWRYFRQCVRTDLDAAPDSGTLEGIHLAAMAGAVDVLQRHYLGLYPAPDALHLCPAIPVELKDVTLGFCFQGRKMQVRLTATQLSLHLAASARAVDVVCAGQRRRLLPGQQILLDR